MCTALQASFTDHSTTSSNLTRIPKQFVGSGDERDPEDSEGILFSGGRHHNRLPFDYHVFLMCNSSIPTTYSSQKPKPDSQHLHNPE